MVGGSTDIEEILEIKKINENVQNLEKSINTSQNPKHFSRKLPKLDHRMSDGAPANKNEKPQNLPELDGEVRSVPNQPNLKIRK